LAPTKWRKTEARRDRGGLPEGGSGGGVDKRLEGVFFYSRALPGDNADLRKEGEREVMAQHGGRATGVHARAARRSSDVAVAAALCGGYTEGICSYAIGEEVSWTGDGWWWPRGMHGCASAWCLCGAGLGSWRLDGAARGASKEGGSRGAARGIVTGCLASTSGSSAAMTVIDQCNRMTRCLGGIVACH
jgi:hypothetical protein